MPRPMRSLLLSCGFAVVASSLIAQSVVVPGANANAVGGYTVTNGVSPSVN